MLAEDDYLKNYSSHRHSRNSDVPAGSDSVDNDIDKAESKEDNATPSKNRFKEIGDKAFPKKYRVLSRHILDGIASNTSTFVSAGAITTGNVLFLAPNPIATFILTTAANIGFAYENYKSLSESSAKIRLEEKENANIYVRNVEQISKYILSLSLFLTLSYLFMAVLGAFSGIELTTLEVEPVILAALATFIPGFFRIANDSILNVCAAGKIMSSADEESPEAAIEEAELQDDIEKERDALNLAKERNQELEFLLEEREKVLSDLEKQLEDAHKEIEILKGNITELRDNLRRDDNNIENLESLLDGKEQKLLGLQQQIKEKERLEARVLPEKQDDSLSFERNSEDSDQYSDFQNPPLEIVGTDTGAQFQFFKRQRANSYPLLEDKVRSNIRNLKKSI